MSKKGPCRRSLSSVVLAIDPEPKDKDTTPARQRPTKHSCGASAAMISLESYSQKPSVFGAAPLRGDVAKLRSAHDSSSIVVSHLLITLCRALSMLSASPFLIISRLSSSGTMTIALNFISSLQLELLPGSSLSTVAVVWQAIPYLQGSLGPSNDWLVIFISALKG